MRSATIGFNVERNDEIEKGWGDIFMNKSKTFLSVIPDISLSFLNIMNLSQTISQGIFPILALELLLGTVEILILTFFFLI